jgi:hypothetical protein
LIVSCAIGERDVPQFQCVRGEDGEWRTGITVTRQNVDDDIGGMDAFRSSMFRKSCSAFSMRTCANSLNLSDSFDQMSPSDRKRSKASAQAVSTVVENRRQDFHHLSIAIADKFTQSANT